MELTFLILKDLQDIVSGDDYNSGGFIGRFSRSVVRDNDYMYILAEKVSEMIDDNDLSKEECRKLFKEDLNIKE